MHTYKLLLVLDYYYVDVTIIQELLLELFIIYFMHFYHRGRQRP